eukprot:2531000-Prymnesium_polylepis.1
MAGVYATRLAGSAGGRPARSFRRFHRQHIASALANGACFRAPPQRASSARAPPPAGGCA